MIETRTVCIPTETKCHIQYYVYAHPEVDPHFAPESPYIVENKFFETKEEALALKEEKEKLPSWTWYEVREKITPLN